MNFSQAEAHLLGTVNESVSARTPYRLDRMRALLRALGDPQDRYPTLHIGGTSGKGSTSTMIASALSASGKRIGLHTKPHLTSMTERARIDGIAVSEDRFAELLGGMLPAIEIAAAEHGAPSYYETLLALAFAHFAAEGVDAAVIEVGVGGKLDGTNVLLPVVSAITNVGLDHTDILGDTVEEIARDKSGIAKKGVPLVSAVDHPGARAIIEEACARAQAPFVSVLDTVTVTERPAPLGGQHLSIGTPEGSYDVSLPVLGTFQQINAATAIRVLEQLAPPLRPATQAIEDGLARVVLPGRMEYFPAHPGVIFDVAHNPDKARHLAASLERQFPGRRFAFVLAIGQSKDARDILRAFQKLPSSFIFTSFETPGRTAAKPQRLASIADSLGMWGRAVSDPAEAFAIARRTAAADEIVVVTGSTFVVAQLREWWMEHAVASRSPI